MLSNIVFIIILILLIIILILLYFFSNDIRKNKNKINICESDINSMRERISTLQQKVLSVENNLNNDFSKKPKMNMDPSFMKNSDGADFAGILETLGGMNNFYQANNNGIFSNNEEDDEEDDEEED
jgi:regulatory protein YycI of two-component signal transduction system YycFG